MAKAKIKAKTQASYSHGVGILGIIFMTAGIYFLVAGFQAQLVSSVIFWNWTAILYYLVGLLLFGFGKIGSRRGYGLC